jgi:hypothetical protein
MHPDDWCIPRRDVYRILHFVGPELWGSVWPGPPRGWRGVLPGRSARPVRRVPVRLVGGGGGGGSLFGGGGGLRAVRHDGGQADGVHAVPRGQLLLGQVPEAALPGAQGGLPRGGGCGLVGPLISRAVHALFRCNGLAPPCWRAPARPAPWPHPGASSASRPQPLAPTVLGLLRASLMPYVNTT